MQGWNEMAKRETARRPSFLLFDGCNYRSLLFTNPLFRGLFHF